MGEFREKNEWQILNSRQILAFAIQLWIKMCNKACYSYFWPQSWQQFVLRNGTVPDMQDERLIRLEQEAEQSIQILLDISRLPLGSRLMIPSDATFVPLVEDMHDKQTPDWSLGERISSSQFICMVSDEQMISHNSNTGTRQLFLLPHTLLACNMQVSLFVNRKTIHVSYFKLPLLRLNTSTASRWIAGRQLSLFTEDCYA